MTSNRRASGRCSASCLRAERGRGRNPSRNLPRSPSRRRSRSRIRASSSARRCSSSSTRRESGSPSSRRDFANSTVPEPTGDAPERLTERPRYPQRVKVGIVVPYSWSFWGAVVEHAELQAAALRALGFDVRLIAGNDPPGSLTRMLHPRLGRHDGPPAHLIPVGRSVIVPANGSLPNVVLSPSTFFRLRARLERERFDVL